MWIPIGSLVNCAILKRKLLILIIFEQFMRISCDLCVIHKPLQFFVLATIIIIIHDKNNILLLLYLLFFCLLVINVRSFVIVVVLQLSLNNALDVKEGEK